MLYVFFCIVILFCIYLIIYNIKEDKCLFFFIYNCLICFNLNINVKFSFFYKFDGDVVF